jgi:YD repeat-containing protein
LLGEQKFVVFPLMGSFMMVVLDIFGDGVMEERLAEEDHLLTGIINPSGISTLSAAYDDQGRLTSLTGATGSSASVGTGGFDGNRAGQSVTDPAGDATQDMCPLNKPHLPTP